MLESIAVKSSTPLQLLTAAQKDGYESQGFLILPNFVSESICDLLIDRANFLVDSFDVNAAKVIFSTKHAGHIKQNYFLESSDKAHFFFEENAFDANGHLTIEKSLAINKIGHALHDVDPIFSLFTRQHKLLALGEDLNLINPLFLQSMYIFKQPFIGGEVNCHQDSSYLYLENKPVTGFWFALQDATHENGCLWAIPGGHREKLKMRLLRKDNQLQTEIYDDTPWILDQMIPLEVKRGSLIVLHGHLPHMSYENRSAFSRHAYTLHMMSITDHYAETNWLQRKMFTGFF